MQTINGIMLSWGNVETEGDPEEFIHYIWQDETREVRVELLFDDDPALPHISTIYSVGFDLSFSKPTDEYPPEYIDENVYFQLSTSAASEGQQEYVPSEPPLFDENGIKAYYLGSSYNAPADDDPYYEYLLYIVNDTDREIWGNIYPTAVDGADPDNYSAWTSCELFPHTGGFSTIWLRGASDKYVGEEGTLEIDTYQLDPDNIPALTVALEFEDYDDETVLANGQISLSPKDINE